MKKIILMVVLAIGMIATTFGQLNAEAQVLKSDQNDVYSHIKKSAESEWKGNHEMIVYVINNQSKAFFEILKAMKETKYDEKILQDAVNEWNENNTINYEMVIYVYRNQLKAKNSY